MYNQQNHYIQTSIATAPPAKLLLMLYDGAIRFCKSGVEALKMNRTEEAEKEIDRVIHIIEEFMATLDQNVEISENLMQLYEYFIFRLNESVSKQTTAPAEEVLGHLVELRRTWAEANKMLASQKPASGVQYG